MSISPHNWDIIVIGGALSGSSAATLLRRRNPQLSVLILEKTERLTRRVGESTVEVSAYFLGRVLGLSEHLVEHHLPKQGLRYWFTNARTKTLNQCSETGPRYNVRLPGFQIDRAVLDEHMLATATAEGATLQRSVRVRSVGLVSGGKQTVEWEDETSGEHHTSTARWVIDASGCAAVLSRQEGWIKPNQAHPIASCWSRWHGVKSLDCREFASRWPSWSSRVKGQRGVATNHIMGYGWWAWFIPLKGGDTSVGIVYDQRLAELPAGDSMGERLRAMLNTHPAAREMIAEATWQAGDVHFRRNLAYSCTTHATNGAVVVGDAAGFIDPFYSPGLDWITFTVCGAVGMIEHSFRGKPVEPRVEQHNREFRLSYERMFQALYLNKYHYMGDFELMSLAFRLDLGLYYLGVVMHPFQHGGRILENPPFTHAKATWPYRLMVRYNRRLAAIGAARQRRGTWGRYNDRHFFGFISYEFNRRLYFRIFGSILHWIGLELREGWRSWFSPTPTSSGLKTEPISK